MKRHTRLLLPVLLAGLTVTTSCARDDYSAVLCVAGYREYSPQGDVRPCKNYKTTCYLDRSSCNFSSSDTCPQVEKPYSDWLDCWDDLDSWFSGSSLPEEVDRAIGNQPLQHPSRDATVYGSHAPIDMAVPDDGGVPPTPDYSGPACTAGICPSCAAVLAADPGSKSGTYTIRPDPVAPPFDVHCDMTTDGGGWTLLGKQVAGMSSSDCSQYWSSGAAGRDSPAPLPDSNSGTTTRFPFSVFNAIATTNPNGAFKVTSDYPNAFVSYWKAACKITNWDAGTSECFQDFADPACTSPRRKGVHHLEHGVLQGYTGHSGMSDVFLAATTFQVCSLKPAVGYHNGSGKYAGYKHNIGLMVWFR